MWDRVASYKGITMTQKPCLFCQEASELEHELMKERDVYRASPTFPLWCCCEGCVTALACFQGRMAPVAVLAHLRAASSMREEVPKTQWYQTQSVIILVRISKHHGVILQTVGSMWHHLPPPLQNYVQHGEWRQPDGQFPIFLRARKCYD